MRGQDLNLRPSGYEPDELPGCSTPRQSGRRLSRRPSPRRRAYIGNPAADHKRKVGWRDSFLNLAPPEPPNTPAVLGFSGLCRGQRIETAGENRGICPVLPYQRLPLLGARQKQKRLSGGPPRLVDRFSTDLLEYCILMDVGTGVSLPFPRAAGLPRRPIPQGRRGPSTG